VTRPSRAARLAAGFFSCVLAFFVAGCAQLVPQTVALRTGWPEGVPQHAVLEDVPFFPQEDYQCGPAALATLLAFTGAPATPDALVSQVYVPARQGSLQLEMIATPRRWSRVPFQLSPRYADVLREVAAGNPVVVLQDTGDGLFFTSWHYAVIYGFDYASGTLYLRSGTTKQQEMPFTAFEREWMKSGYWAMVVTRPDRIAATATEQSWMQAVLAMDRAADAAAATQAYVTALERWPDNVAAAIGLANRYHASGLLGRADTVLRGALQRHPQSVIVMNNLAQTLSDQGRNAEALAQIDKAAEDTQSPFASEVQATRKLIVERMAQHASAKR